MFAFTNEISYNSNLFVSVFPLSLQLAECDDNVYVEFGLTLRVPFRKEIVISKSLGVSSESLRLVIPSIIFP